MDRSEWRTGGANLAAAAVAQCFVVMHLYSLGMFMEPLQEEFGWSRTFVASGMTLQSVIVVLGAPFLGMVIDRVGPRLIGIVGITLYFTAFGCLALMTGSTIVYFALWAFLAMTNLSVKTTVWLAAIIRCFVKHRGMAIAIVISGTSVGAIVIPVLANFYIERFGWRGGYIGLAATGFLLAGPLVLLFFGRSDGTVTAARSSAGQPVEPLRGQLLSLSFLQLATVAIFCSLCLVGISTHLVPITGQYGIGRDEAAKIAGLLGASSLIGRLSTGIMIDRWPARIIGAAFIGLGVVGALLLLVAQSPPTVWFAVVLLGLCLGAEIDVVAYLAARVFGPAHFATLFGIIVGLLTLCTGVGPLAAAVVFDTTDSYRLWFWISAAALSVSAFLILTVRDRPGSVPAPAA